MKTNKSKELLIEQLRKTPIIQVSCEKTMIGRASFYRWRDEDKEFAKAAEKAIAEGEMLITDLSELQLINLIRDKNFPAINLWLRVHSKKYSNKVEVTGSLNIKEKPLSAEQQELVKKALGLAGLLTDKRTEKNYEHNSTESAGGCKP